MKDKNITLYYNSDFDIRYGISININEFKEYIPHTHDFYEFEYVLEGESQCEINGRCFAVKPGDLVFSTPSCITSYKHSDDKIRLFTLHFNTGILKNFNELAQIAPCVLNDVPEMEQMFYDLKNLWGTFDKYSYAAILNATERIIIHFLKHKDAKEEVEFSANINFARSYIIHHFRENLTLESLSAKLGYTPAYFSRLFKEKTGHGFSEYLTDIRLDYARSVLETTHISICDICFECGFNSIRTFSRAYKRKFGISPSQNKMTKNDR